MQYRSDKPNLVIVDAMSVINSVAGAMANFGIGAGDNYLEKFPTGGIYRLMTMLLSKARLSHGHIVICFDRHSKRKDIDKDYKGDRIMTPRKLKMIHQAKELEKWLRAIGYCVLSQEGYEADDLIYSVVMKYRNDYNKIEIITTDRDLATLVDSDISLTSCNSNVSDLNLYNFTGAYKSGMKLVYNATILYKIFYGDADNIEPVYMQKEFHIDKFNEMCIMILNKYKLPLSDERIIMAVISKLGVGKSELAIHNYSLIKLMYTEIEIEESIVKRDKLVPFLSTFRLKSLATRLNLPYDGSLNTNYVANLVTEFNTALNRLTKTVDVIDVIETSSSAGITNSVTTNSEDGIGGF